MIWFRFGACLLLVSSLVWLGYKAGFYEGRKKYIEELEAYRASLDEWVQDTVRDLLGEKTPTRPRPKNERPS